MSEIKIVFAGPKYRLHPNESKYCGEASMDTMSVYMDLMSELDSSSFEKLMKREYIFDRESVDDFISEVKVGDKIGFIFLEENGWTPSCFQVNDINEEIGSLHLQKVNLYSKKLDLGEKKIAYRPDISTAILMNYCEILHRDGKTYGFTKHMIKIEDEQEPQ